jgi:uncharacterized protein YjbI with pentapeptide repeats
MDVKELLAQYNQGKRDFSDIELGECHLIGAELSDIVLRRAQLNVANFSSANLSRADLSQAQLNVSRLTGVNLTEANLSGCKLNVANLIRATLVDANLATASLIRGEMLRVNLTNAHAVAIDLSEADLREAQVRQANFNLANLSRTDLRGSSWVGASLEQAILNNTNANRANFQGANLAGAELRHGVLTQVNLSGASLRNVNLRWANLSGANLRNADLTNAKLSGAKLVGTSFEGANLTNTLLVHADLHHANLMHSTWIDSDASGANLSGVKLFGALRDNLTLQDANCQWIDLSPNGDRHRIQQFASARDMHLYFSRALSQVKLVVNAELTPAGLREFSKALCQIAEINPALGIAPAIEPVRRQTSLTFTAANDSSLLALAYGAVMPFQQGKRAQNILTHLATPLKEIIQLPSTSIPAKQIMTQMLRHMAKAHTSLAPLREATTLPGTHPFLQATIQLILLNSSNSPLTLYPGTVLPTDENETEDCILQPRQDILPTKSALMTFIEGCHQP